MAVKVLPADRLSDEPRRRRFVREARSASALNHPNIVTIHEIESADGMDFIVFSFGAVLYEVVTGRRAFAGGSRAETLAAVLTAAPAPPREITADVPVELEKLILRCLRKEPVERYQHMGDVKVRLEEIREGRESRTTHAPRTATRKALVWSMATFGILLAGVGLRIVAGPGFGPPPQLVRLTATRGLEIRPSLSPDGTQVAFAWEGESGNRPGLDIWLKLVGSSEARRLTSDPAVDGSPSWSPDGHQIAFLRAVKGQPHMNIHVISPLGGQDFRVSTFPAAMASRPAWSPDGRWLVARRKRTNAEWAPGAAGLFLIPVGQGEPRSITSPKPPAYDAHPAFSPDGKRLAYVSCPREGFSSGDPCDIHVLELGLDLAARHPPRRLTRQALGVMGLAWTRDGKDIVYSAGTGLLFQISLARQRHGQQPSRASGTRSPGRRRSHNRDEPGSPRVHPGSPRLQYLSLRAGSPQPGARGLVVLGLQPELLPRRASLRLPVRRFRRARRGLAGRGQRHEPGAAHARPRERAGRTALVAGRPPDRLRVARRRRLHRPVGDRGGGGIAAPPHADALQRPLRELVA